MEAAKKQKQLIHQYDKISDDHVRILTVSPAKDPRSEVVVSLRTLTFEELENWKFEALSYHVS